MEAFGQYVAPLEPATEDYILDTNEWQVVGITKALASLDRGKGIARARVSEWVASWETRRERRSPRGV